jgi:hypothetical protein
MPKNLTPGPFPSEKGNKIERGPFASGKGSKTRRAPVPIIRFPFPQWEGVRGSVS